MIRGLCYVVVITYGHRRSLVTAALASTQQVIREGFPVRALIVDDCSNRPPHVEGAMTRSTPSHGGYAAALNFVIDEYGTQARRIVFVNPDASVPVTTLKRLLDPPGPSPLVAPSIRRGRAVDNVRSELRPSQVLTQIITPRFGRQQLLSYAPADRKMLVGSPWVPSGAILSVDPSAIADSRFRSEMFWLEMSAWSRDNRGRYTFLLLRDVAEHVGGSTKGHASMLVAASELQARISFVRVYGSRVTHWALPFAVILGCFVGLARGQYQWRDAGRLWQIYRGVLEWQSV